jgi:hypothetical protein
MTGGVIQRRSNGTKRKRKVQLLNLLRQVAEKSKFYRTRMGTRAWCTHEKLVDGHFDLDFTIAQGVAHLIAPCHHRGWKALLTLGTRGDLDEPAHRAERSKKYDMINMKR